MLISKIGVEITSGMIPIEKLMAKKFMQFAIMGKIIKEKNYETEY